MQRQAVHPRIPNAKLMARANGNLLFCASNLLNNVNFQARSPEKAAMHSMIVFCKLNQPAEIVNLQL